MAQLVLGPIQRGLATDIRIWVETDEPCRVEVLGHRCDTWSVAGHHFGLVELDRLAPGTDTTYDVRLDGEVVWPAPDDDRPAPRVRTWDGEAQIKILVGSCRQPAPPSLLESQDHDQGDLDIGTDALDAFARALAAGEEDVQSMLLVGDQVYADEPDPRTVGAMRARRGGPPREGWPEVSGFEEYTWLYQESWSAPWIRWLMASVPSLMIFDDHDIIDDWNTSAAWRRRIEGRSWWTGRIQGGLMAYWLYQHIGNVGTGEGEDAGLLDQIRAAGPHGEQPLRDFARRADIGTADDVGHRWSFSCEVGGSRLVVLDSRNGRVLEPARRSMLGPAEWSWLDERMTGDVDHLFIVSSVPWILPRAIHYVEAWNEALAEGAWGRLGAGASEWLRQQIDLEHWAAFGHSSDDLADLITDVSSGERGTPPETVTVMSGDVHFGYVAEVDLGGRSRVRQVVSSPFRQAVTTFDLRAQRAAMRAPVSWLCRALVATTPSARPRFHWDVTNGPWFDEHLTVLTVDGRRAHVSYRTAGLDDTRTPVLTEVAARDL